MHFILGKIEELGSGPFLPSEAGARLDKVDVEFLHVSGRLRPEKRDLRVQASPANENLSSLYQIREPMCNCIAESENVNAPGHNAVVLNLIHVFPCELMMLPQIQCNNVSFSACPERIGLSAEFFPPSLSNDLNSHCSNVVFHVVCEVYYNSLKAVVIAMLQCYGFVLGFIANVANINSSDLEKL